MSDNDGPVMLAATPVMRPGRTRIGKIGGNITLPRTISLISLFAGGGGVLLGAMLGAVVAGASFAGLFYGAIFGGAAGVFLVTYSPLQGESMLTWLGLTVRSRRRRVRIDGKVVTLSVGVFPIERAPVGWVGVVRGAVRIPSGEYDERGVLISATNRNTGVGAVTAADPSAKRRTPWAVSDSAQPQLPGADAHLPKDADAKSARRPKRTGRGSGKRGASTPAAADAPLQLPPARRLKD